MSDLELIALVHRVASLAMLVLEGAPVARVELQAARMRLSAEMEARKPKPEKCVFCWSVSDELDKSGACQSCAPDAAAERRADEQREEAKGAYAA